MWSALKSDLQEFVSGATEETSAVVTRAGLAPLKKEDGGSGGYGVGGGARHGVGRSTGYTSSSAENDFGAAAASNWSASVSIPTSRMSVSGLSSMFGGVVVAPVPGPSPSPAPTVVAGSCFGGVGGPTAAPRQHQPQLPPPPASLSTLANEEEEEEEEELGWDDEDEDDVFEEGNEDFRNEVKEGGDVGSSPAVATWTVDGGSNRQNENNMSRSSCSSSETLTSLRSKLATTEKERDDLQERYGEQTALLVELRAKAAEREQGIVDESNVGGEEIEVLRRELEQLRSQVEQKSQESGEAGDASDEYTVTVKALREEKEILELELLQSISEIEALKEGMLSAVEDPAQPAELQQQDEQQKDKICALVADLDSLQRELEAARLESKNMEDMQSSQRKQMEDTEVLSAVREDELRLAREETQSLRCALSELERARDRASELAHNAQLRYAESKEEIKRLRVETSTAGKETNEKAASTVNAAASVYVGREPSLLSSRIDTPADDKDDDRKINEAEDAMSTTPIEFGAEGVSSGAASATPVTPDDDEDEDDWGEGDWGDDL